jgi:hypothetical protein
LFLWGCASTPPGTRNADCPHVIAAKTGGWKPEPGYSWVYPDRKSTLLVRWEPGKAYWYLGTIQWLHVIASTTEGSWQPEPGYVWANLDQGGNPISGNLAVRWQAGLPYAYLGNIQWPHVIASATEGSWQPEPGYVWANLDQGGNPISGNFAVRWGPGEGYWYLGTKQWPHVVASSTEGLWLPESDYTWAHLDDKGHPTDFAVVSISELRAEKDRWNALNDHWTKYLNEIQAENDYLNWSGPPFDLYRTRHRN